MRVCKDNFTKGNKEICKFKKEEKMKSDLMKEVEAI